MLKRPITPCYMCNWTIIMSGQGVVERASAELSKRINGLSLRVGKQHRNVGKSSSVMERMTNVFCGNSNNNNNNNCNNINSNANNSTGIAPIMPTVSTGTEKIRCRVSKTPQQLRRAVYIKSRPVTLNDLFMDEEFLSKFFWYFSSTDRSNLARVCTRWKEILYRNQKYWSGLSLNVHCKQFRHSTSYEKTRLYASFIRRGLRSLGLVGAKDEDIIDMMNYFPLGSKHVHSAMLKWCGISDKGLENFMEHLTACYELELCGCNDVTENGLWNNLPPRLVSLKLADCINVSDESIGAVAQILPHLCEFSLQAYHVTDAALGFFSTKQSPNLNIFKLQSCWEITNHGIVNIVHSLPNLTVLSLAGCTKITDDGIELISENLRKLRSLDLSWCPRITDIALEYIACDLTVLQQLTLDRCVNITDIGVGYLSTMPCLQVLFLRWCSQIRDSGVQHLSTMRSLEMLSVAGCPLLTMGGLCSLTQMKNLRELELTNCPSTTPELFQYLREQLPRCVIIE